MDASTEIGKLSMEEALKDLRQGLDSLEENIGKEEQSQIDYWQLFGVFDVMAKGIWDYAETFYDAIGR